MLDIPRVIPAVMSITTPFFMVLAGTINPGFRLTITIPVTAPGDGMSATTRGADGTLV